MLAFTCAGIGAIAAILWELAEYATFILNTSETVGIYRDTIGDEVLGLGGAALAGVLTALYAAWRPAVSPAVSPAASPADPPQAEVRPPA
jgi:hypothetical protein